jgi:hypothetical protein
MAWTSPTSDRSSEVGGTAPAGNCPATEESIPSTRWSEGWRLVHELCPQAVQEMTGLRSIAISATTLRLPQAGQVVIGRRTTSDLLLSSSSVAMCVGMLNAVVP